MSDSNQRKALAEVLTAEAWHDAFTNGRTCSDLHVDVVFGLGRIGGGDPSGVRFRLSLKRAEIVIIVPEHEPVAVNPASVRRDSPKEITGRIETKAKVSKGGSVSLSGNVGASTKGVKAAANAKATVALAVSKNRTATTTRAFKGLEVTQNKDAENNYRWVIEPALGAAHLSGRPWDALKAPRLQLIDQRSSNSKSMPPTVRVEVRCLREDLEISHITLGDASTFAVLKRRKAAATRRIAAEAAIRTLLTEAGLLTGDMSDPYAQLMLAMTTADAV